ncbi:TraR/DksA C4-type zinc finger protein [Porphyromonadaceae bacterium]
MSEKTRYSDEELEEFKAIILEKLEKAQSDYDLLRGALNNTDGNDITDTSPTFKVLEEELPHTQRRRRDVGSASDEVYPTSPAGALIRIENKTYGVCRETGKLIPKERLRAVPHATLSIEAKSNSVNNRDREESASFLLSVIHTD